MEVRRTLWLPLDDLLVVVREFLNPKVSRSGLARCMERLNADLKHAIDQGAGVYEGETEKRRHPTHADVRTSARARQEIFPGSAREIRRFKLQTSAGRINSCHTANTIRTTIPRR
jgi:hypothetical protein